MPQECGGKGPGPRLYPVDTWICLEWLANSISMSGQNQGCFFWDILTSGIILNLCRLVGDNSCNSTKRGGCLQGRGNKVSVSIHLDHQDAHFECAVDLAILHEIAPYDSLGHVLLLAARLQVWYAGSGTHSAAVGSPPPACQMVPDQSLALLDILAQINSDDAQGGFLGHGKLLDNLKLNGTLGKATVSVYRDSNVLNMFAEAVIDTMVGDGVFRSAAAVLGMHRMGKMPFYEGVARNQGNIVKIVDLLDSRAGVSKMACRTPYMIVVFSP